MKKLFLLTILLHLTFIVKAQTSLSLDSCRALALTNNKDLLISHEKINAAHYQRKAAFTNYLPNFSATDKAGSSLPDTPIAQQSSKISSFVFIVYLTSKR